MKKKNNLQAYAFLTPFLILVTLLYILPAVLTVVMAFTGLDKTFVWKFVGMKNFRRVFMDPNTPIIVRNTLIYVGVCISATLVIDLFFAIMTTYFIKSERSASIFKGILMIPMITPSVVYSVLWVWLLSSTADGFFNKIVMGVSGMTSPINWIAQYPTASGHLCQTADQHCLWHDHFFQRRLRAIPENQFKAARVDGAKEWEIVQGDYSAESALPYHVYRVVGYARSVDRLCQHPAHYGWRSRQSRARYGRSPRIIRRFSDGQGWLRRGDFAHFDSGRYSC